MVTIAIVAALGVFLVENADACPGCRGILAAPETVTTEPGISPEPKTGVWEEISKGFAQWKSELDQRKAEFLSLIELILVGKPG